MELNTEKSGTRIFHPVKSSGQVGCSRVLKLVPGKSTQPHTLITYSVHVVSDLPPQSKALTVPPDTASRGQCENLLTASRLNHTVNPKAQIPSPFLHSAPIKTFLPSSPLKPTTVAVIPETATQASQKAPSKKTVVGVSESKNVHIVEPAQSEELHLFTPCAHPAADTIRTFLKVSRFPQKPSSPIQWAMEDSGCSPNRSSKPSVVSPAVVSEALEVMSNGEQWSKDNVLTQTNEVETDPTEKQPEFCVVMFDDKIFFRIKKKESKEGELIDLCCDEVLNGGPDEDSVTFVCCTPAPAVSLVPGRTGQAPEGSSTADSTQTEGHMPRGHIPLSQMSSAPTPAPCPMADHKLKQLFGITSEVEIRLPRMVSCDADVNVAFHVPPLDYTQPIEEDFLCAADASHSQHCPQVEGSASRVGRTRKRTKCPCCSPAILHHYHPSQTRRAKPGLSDRRETVRRQLPMTAPLTTSVPTPLIVPVTTTVTTPHIPWKQTKMQPTPAATPVTTPETTTVSTTATAPQIPRKQTKPRPSPVTASVPTSATTIKIPRRKSKFLPTPLLTIPQIAQKKARLKIPLVSTPVTTPMANDVTTTHMPQTRNNLTPTPVTAPVSILTTTAVTTPETSTHMTDKDSEEMRIHKEIEVLREALRIKEAALARLKSDKNR